MFPESRIRCLQVSCHSDIDELHLFTGVSSAQLCHSGRSGRKNIEVFLTLKIRIMMMILKTGKSETDLSYPCGKP